MQKPGPRCGGSTPPCSSPPLSRKCPGGPAGDAGPTCFGGSLLRYQRNNEELNYGTPRFDVFGTGGDSSTNFFRDVPPG
ncbi:hypothetical protein ACOMHN_013907 [Nucella lapillus]